jgi:cytoskeletal protein RodZ
LGRAQATTDQDGTVRRTLLYVASWFAAGVGAVALATVGVSMVGRQVTTTDRPAPLSADEVRSELEAETATTTTVPEAATTTLPGGSGATTTTTGRGAGATTTTVPSGSGGSVTPPTTAAPAPAPVLRTYALVGGTVTLSFSPSGVTWQSPTPNPGFEVEITPTHGNGVRVEFRNDTDDRRSRVEGWWDGGPQDEVDESD